MNGMVAMEEIEVVGVVKAQPLSLSRQGKSRIKRHLRQVGWRFAWLLFFQRIVQGLGYALSLLMPDRARRWLPAYRVAMTYFWVLHNGSDRGGVSVHWIDKGIDTGEIIERRSFPIAEHATQETVLMLTAVIGARLLRRVIRRLQNGQPARNVLLEIDAPTADYYPMPGSS